MANFSFKDFSNSFSLDTKSHGLVEFSNLSPWRTARIINSVSNINKTKGLEFTLIVAKFMLSKIENVIYDEKLYNTLKKYSEINLVLCNLELNDFASLFVSHFITKNANNIKTNTESEKNHLLIKTYFLTQKEQFGLMVENATKLKNMVYDEKIMEQINKLNEASIAAFQKIPKTVIQDFVKLSEQIKNVQNNDYSNAQMIKDYTPNLTDYKLKALIEINNTLKLFIKKYDAINEYNKVRLDLSSLSINQIKENHEVQLEKSTEDSKSAKRRSTIAIIITAAALIISIIFGSIQIALSDNSNHHINELNKTITDLNTSNNSYIEQLEILTNELIDHRLIINSSSDNLD